MEITRAVSTTTVLDVLQSNHKDGLVRQAGIIPEMIKQVTDSIGDHQLDVIA